MKNIKSLTATQNSALENLKGWNIYLNTSWSDRAIKGGHTFHQAFMFGKCIPIVKLLQRLIFLVLNRRFCLLHWLVWITFMQLFAVFFVAQLCFFVWVFYFRKSVTLLCDLFSYFLSDLRFLQVKPISWRLIVLIDGSVLQFRPPNCMKIWLMII